MSLRLGKDLLLETKKLLMSHCFAERQAEMLTSSIEFVVHSAFFHPYYLLLSQLHYRIVTLSRVIGIIMREFYTRKFGFEVLGDNIKVFHKQE